MDQKQQTKQFKARDGLITLGQLLKAVDLITSGAEAKEFLATETIWVNGEVENRRGKKLVPGDIVEFENGSSVVIT